MVILVTLAVPAAKAATDVAIPAKPAINWQTVVNNGDYIPTDNCNPAVPTDPPCRKFNSYNQPSLNTKKLVVFRARSKGGKGGESVHGVYTRDMARVDPIVRILDRETLVPQPNNLGARFVEPPSFPRIDMDSNMIATRGNHQPVWQYTLPDGTDTKVGTTGIYTNPFGPLITGSSKLGAVPEFSYFQVPEFPGTPFDVFPGAPAVTKGSTVVFKANYTVDLVAKTGVYYRNLNNQAINTNPVVLIANNTHTLIPGTRTVFGSTAPPSAVGSYAVFAGFDNEENPTSGGIYLAALAPYKPNKQPKLKALVTIGTHVPGEAKSAVFNKLGEGVSFDGRFVAFWGAWGNETRIVRLYCRNEGNKDLKAYCMSSESGNQEDANGNWYTEKEVPLNQGIFVRDIKNNKISRIARTGGEFSDFVYWNFSGKAPGIGEGGESDDDGELARWRSATFIAVSGRTNENGRKKDDMNDSFGTAFKARTGVTDTNNVYVDPVDGIYLRNCARQVYPVITLVKSGMDGTIIDPEAVYVDEALSGSLPVPLTVTEMGIERDGFRGNSLAINVSMGTEEAGWAGIYLTRISDK